MQYRIGLGFDAHRLSPGRRLVLGGVEIVHDRGLEGHSDGDVLLHALTDALLGAVGAPDIGSLFPSDEARWKGAASRIFVEKAVGVVNQRGFRVAQVDAVVIAEEPRLGPYVEAMRSRIAEMVGVAPTEVGVKATTTDGMGFAGRREGVAAQAVVLLASREAS